MVSRKTVNTLKKTQEYPRRRINKPKHEPNKLLTESIKEEEDKIDILGLII